MPTRSSTTGILASYTLSKIGCPKSYVKLGPKPIPAERGFYLCGITIQAEIP